MIRFLRARLRTLLVLLLISTATVGVGITAYFSYRIIHDLLLNTLQSNALTTVRQIGSDLDGWLAVRKAELTMLAQSPPLLALDWQLIQPYLQAEQQRLPAFSRFALVQADGSLYSVTDGPTSINVADRDYFQQAVQGQIYVSDPLVSRLLHMPALVIAAPVGRAAPARAVLSGVIALAAIRSIEDKLRYSPDSYAFVLDRQGQPFIAVTPAGSDRAERYARLADTSRQRSGIERRQLNGQSFYLIHLPLAQAGWSLLLLLPTDSIDAQLQPLNLLAVFLGVLLLAAVFTALLQTFLVERLKQHTERLDREVAQRRQAETELERVNAALQRLAVEDELTGVANRRRFDETLAREWRRTLREGVPLALIMCDIDYFKPYNDTYGHQAGDDSLRQVAQALQQTIKRAAELVARYGGEEFAVILPDVGPDEARRLAETLRQQVEALAIPHSASPFGHLTISLGVASLIPQPDTSARQLIAHADRALYQAKEQGRNCLR